MECPVCGSSNVTASHRRGTENLFRYLLPRAPYRCKDCWSRFWRTENPFKTTASKLGALAVLLLVAAVVSLPFWGPAGKGPDSETPEESYTLPVPTHRSAQRSYDGDAGRPAPAPGPELEAQEDSAAPTYAQAGRPDSAAGPETPAGSPSLTPMAGAPPQTGPEPETEPGGETPTGAVPPIAAGPAEPDDGEAASSPAASETGTADSSDAAGAAEDAEAAAPAERAEAEVADPAVAANAASPEPSAPESAAVGDAEPSPGAESQPAEATEISAVSPETETPSPGAGELPPAPSGPRTLTALAPRSGDGSFELAASAGGPVEDANIFPLSDPPKLVVDLAGKWDRKVKSPVAVDGPLVKQVRLGNHPEYLRLVLDLAQTGPPGETVGHEFVPTAEGFRLRLFPEGGS